MRIIVEYLFWRALFRIRGSATFIILVFLIYLLTHLNPVAARTNKLCLNKQVVPEISFSVKNAKAVLNRSKTSEQITRFAKSIDAYKPTTRGRLLGLAYTEVQPNLGVGVEEVFRKSNNKCIRLMKVSFAFGLKKSEIFIARKYRPGTCEFKAILAHEREHLNISKKLQTKYSKKLHKEMTRRAKAIKPFFARDANKAANSIVKKLIGQLTPLLDDFKRERKIENYKIDTPQSYRRVRSRCANW